MKIYKLLFKKIDSYWYLFGWILLFSGLLRYVITYDIIRNNVWDALWVCPVISILAGIAFLMQDRFFISGTAVWIMVAPLAVVLSDINKCLTLIGVHHIVSVIALIIILFHFKEAWDSMGMVFGIISFYAYMAITSNLSGERVNLLNNVPLWVGVSLILISIFIFLKNKFSTRIIHERQ